MKENKFERLRLFADKEDVNDTIKEFVRNISYNLTRQNIDEIELVPILRGGMYLSEKIKKLIIKRNGKGGNNFDVIINPIKVKTYNEETLSNNNVEPVIDLMSNNLILKEYKMTILIDDIVDSGKTMKLVRDLYLTQNTSTLFNNNFISLSLLTKNNDLNKEKNHFHLYNIDNYNLDTENIWFVGCGMDLDDKYRDEPELRCVNKNLFLKDKSRFI